MGLLGTLAVVLALCPRQRQPFSSLDGMWVILGSMFIFRMMNYLYDLKHRAAVQSIACDLVLLYAAQRLLSPLPSCRLQEICHSVFQWRCARRTYQTGIDWMFRGIVQLLLYRLVYRFGLLNIADVMDAKDVTEFAVATYLLYLHVSGQFH